MGKIYDLNKHMKNKKTLIEKFCEKNYGIIKAKEDLYLYPEFIFRSYSDNLKEFMKDYSIDFDYGMLQKHINKIVNYDNEELTLTLLKEDVNIKHYELFNLDNNMHLSIGIDMKNLNPEELTALICSLFYYKNIKLTYIKRLKFADLPKL